MNSAIELLKKKTSTTTILTSKIGYKYSVQKRRYIYLVLVVNIKYFHDLKNFFSIFCVKKFKIKR